MVVGIIGAGASGMAAALAAAENPDCRVVLMERQARVGRKLLATGNGRCNITNLSGTEGRYHGDDPAFSRSAIEAFSPEDTLRWMEQLGLYTVAEDSGRVYPYSDQANSVVDILRFALDKPNITLKTGFEAEKIRREGDSFRVESKEEAVQCHRLIVACGGLAGTKLGGSLSGYRLLRGLGHSSTKLRPSLVQLKADWSFGPSLKGVRANCRATIRRNGELFAESVGEIQFTEYGLSGPVIFEISRDACGASGTWVCTLDLLPDMQQEKLEGMLAARKGLPASELFTGILHNRLGRVIVQSAGIRLNDPVEAVQKWQFQRAAELARCLEIPLREPMGMDAAQVTAGGIITAEFDSCTLESLRVPGLYACGEVLDVDGDCGGYNLQWAWSSGRAAGLHAGGMTK